MGIDFWTLADATRRRILTSLQERPGLDVIVDEIAAAEGLHRTVAFTHLEKLADAGLLRRGSRTGKRGRPARTYRWAGVIAEFSRPPRQHRLLASLLAEAVGLRGGADAARRIAAAYGARLEGLSELEGDFELTENQIHARNCVFGEACAVAREVVCGVQAGLLEGALGRPVVPLGPDASGGCRYAIQPASRGL